MSGEATATPAATPATSGGQSTTLTAVPQATQQTQTVAAPQNPYPAEDWRHSLPEDLRGEESLKTIHDIPALAKSFVSTKKAFGANKVALPSKHATEEDWSKFYESVGLPKLEEYKANLPKDAKFVNADFLKELTPVAHKLGVMPKQLEQLVSWYEESYSKSFQNAVAEKQTTTKNEMEALKTEWGQVYDQRVGFASRTVKELGGEGLVKYLNDTGLGNDPKLIKFLGAVGEKLYKEDVPPGHGSGGSNGFSKYDPSTAKQMANEIIRDRQHPYHNPEHPKHAAAMQEVAGLFDMAHGQ